MEEEYCTLCGDPTYRAGIYDDSLYDSNGDGPYCETCYDDLPEPKEQSE